MLRRGSDASPGPAPEPFDDRLGESPREDADDHDHGDERDDDSCDVGHAGSIGCPITRGAEGSAQRSCGLPRPQLTLVGMWFGSCVHPTPWASVNWKRTT